MCWVENDLLAPVCIGLAGNYPGTTEPGKLASANLVKHFEFDNGACHLFLAHGSSKTCLPAGNPTQAVSQRGLSRDRNSKQQGDAIFSAHMFNWPIDDI